LVNQLAILIYLAKPQKPPSNSSSNELAIPGNLLSPSLALPCLRSWRRLAIREIFRRPRLSRVIPSPPARASIFPRFSLARAMKTPQYISSSRRGFLVFHHRDATAVGLRLRASHAAAPFLFVASAGGNKGPGTVHNSICTASVLRDPLVWSAIRSTKGTRRSKKILLAVLRSNLLGLVECQQRSH
jgi:hypothetical protein